MTDYVDNAEGWMNEDPAAGGNFTRVLLRPTVTLQAGSDVDRARSIHTEANRYCFIANSVNFPVDHEPQFRFEAE